jgi:hypothetical protein
LFQYVFITIDGQIVDSDHHILLGFFFVFGKINKNKDKNRTVKTK